MPGTIVCGIDRSAEARAAARLAGTLARRLGWRLELVHVCEPARRPEAGVVAAAQRVVQEQLEWEHVAVIVEAGRVPNRLAAAARNADLLVVGTRGESALRQTLFGSVAASLVRRPRHPVVVVPPDATSRLPLHGRTILCGVRDERDLQWAELAARLATALGLCLSALHVMEPPRVSAVTAAGGAPFPVAVPLDERSRMSVGLRQGFRSSIANTVTSSADIRLLQGLPGPELGRAASEESAAMIAVGASDHSPLGAALAGSTTRRLLREGDRPVLVCPRAADSRGDPRA